MKRYIFHLIIVSIIETEKGVLISIEKQKIDISSSLSMIKKIDF